ncbi:hypothetical protein [Dictyobacter arantiisoli]|uniref:Uncharacterized protein n=1 Tax=Dictyobacter arantiisoli TaxID=2014874 RepID=A0A5A5T787_9CHLR|nr:hypothetical protein [Dictyobacter arantiisoli]GCF07248.1 hypothetical protein KDI_08120 [Dictyobacter arantiisoli]
MNDHSYFVPVTALTSLHTSSVDQPSKEFLLEIWLDDTLSPWRRMLTLHECLASVEQLVSGTTFQIRCHFNRREIGCGQYRKQSSGIVVDTEEGVLMGLFTPLLRVSSTNILQ